MTNVNTNNFLNAVTNPFGATEGTQVPDRFSGNTVCLTDWAEQTPTVGGALLTDMTAICTMVLINYSQLKTTYASDSNRQYQVVTFPLTNAGSLISLTAGGKITSYGSANIGTITGTSLSYDLDDCLVDAYRIFSTGLRVWPLLEVVTDTSTFHIIRHFGGLITPNTVYRSIVDGTNFLDVAKNTVGFKEYAGYEGVTARYNPFVNSFALDMYSLDEHNDAAINWQSIPVPFTISIFSGAVQSTDSAGILFNARYWLEGQLSLPTPIYASMSPIDLGYYNISQLMSRPSNTFPMVVAGHSFLAFAAATASVASFLRTALKTAAVVDSFLDVNAKQGNMRRRKRPRRKAQRLGRKQKPANYRPKQILRPAKQIPRNNRLPRNAR